MHGRVLVDSEIKDLIREGNITTNSKRINTRRKGGQVQPSSLDLRTGFGKNVWHVPYSSIPPGNVLDFLDSESTHSFELSEKRFLHKKSVYVFELEEGLYIPEHMSGRSNPKSTSGRLDVHGRLITENGKGFDDIAEGYNGRLFLELVSNSLDLFVPPGFLFNQVRFFDGVGSRLDQGMLEYLARSEPLLLDGNGKPLDSKEFVREGSVYLTLDLEKPVYRLKDDAPSVDLSLGKESHPASEYFELVKPGKEGLRIFPDSFYLMTSREVVRMPEDHCAEMADILTSLGEFRAHYAGFFDPCFNDFATMEVRNTGTTSFLLRHGKPITSLHFYRLNKSPSVTYGEEKGSSYVAGRTFAKFFDPSK